MNADSDFKVLVLFVCKVETGVSVLLKAEEVSKIVSELHRLDFGVSFQKGGEIGGAAGINQGNTVRICIRQEVLGNVPVNHPKRVGARLLSLIPKVNQKKAGEDECKEQGALLSHAMGLWRQRELLQEIS